jgi:DtxR family transcriptional regulator, Mn-dependent transcriptional regulator
VTLRSLAQRQKISVPAVSRMTLRMLRRRLVERSGACGLALTPAGRVIAVAQVRRQRIAEVYLVRALGYHWTDVYEPARRFCETITDEMIERMFGLAGRPGHCPHGCPIPHAAAASHGTVSEGARLIEIGEIKPGGRARVARVRSHDTALLRYFDQCGLRPGAQIQVGERTPFGDVVRLRTPSGNEAISDSMARMLLFEVIT